MIKQTVTYTGFDDKEHTADFYFHLSVSELMDLEVDQEGGMSNFLTNIVKSGNVQEILKQFKRFISLAYGERTEDGSFEKDERSTAKFMKSPAFDALFLKLVSDPDVLTAFINGMIPKDLVARMNAVPLPEDSLPWANREPTQEELMHMSQEQLLAVYKRRSQQPASQE